MLLALIEPQAGLSIIDITWRLGVALLLVLANAFFVASEFALVGARHTRIESMARAGSPGARLAERAIGRLDHYLSATQLGITIASLGLGFVAEQTVAAVLIQLFSGLAEPWDVIASHAVAGAIAFGLITVMHIVLGELAPKSLAILFPESVSAWTAAPLMAFTWVLGPAIWLLNGMANLLLRALGLRAPAAAERVHRPEEIEMLAIQSFEHGLLAEQPVDMIRGVFDLSETTAGEAMTPRTQVVAVPLGSSIEEVTGVFMEEGHSRIPVYEGSIDRVVGVVLARDVWRAQTEGQTTLDGLIRPVSFVPDSKPIEPLIREMQHQRVHIAIVVDEFGGTAGIITMEDLIEEIVGEIQDEYDDERPEIEETAAGEILLEGSLMLVELNERFELELPEDEYTTVAGYVMGRLGRIARQGDQVDFDGGRLVVLGMSGRRVRRLALELGERQGPAGDGD